MNFINFLREGIKVDQNNHNRSNPKFTQDKATAKKASHNYFGQLVHHKQEIEKRVSWIDDAIEILSVSTAVRNQNLEFWKSKKLKSLAFGAVQTAVALAGAGLIVGANAAAAGVVSMGIGGIALLTMGMALAVLGLYRAHQANEQVKAWKDPIMKYSYIRKQIGVHGFQYIQRNPYLKGTFIHPTEVEKKWSEWSKNFFEKFTNQVNSSQINQFFVQNPLAPKTHHCAFATGTPENLQFADQLSQTYKTIKTSYKKVTALATKQRNEISDRKYHLLDENEKNRVIALQPAKRVLAFFLDSIAAEFTEQLKGPKAQLREIHSRIES